MCVVVNDRQISEESINREMQYHPAATMEEAREAAIQALVVRELLLEEAARLGVDAVQEADEAEDEARIRCLIERQVNVPEPDEASCQRYFEKNRDVLRSAYIHTVSHIMLFAPEEPLAREEADRKARALIEELDGDISRFAEFASRYSDCPSRQEGGRMGALYPGQAVPEFERALTRLTPGQIAPAPIETRYGYHIVYLESRQGGQPYSFEQARPLVADYLRESTYRRELLEYVQQLAEQARIEGFAMPGVQSSLV